MSMFATEQILRFIRKFHMKWGNFITLCKELRQIKGSTTRKLSISLDKRCQLSKSIGIRTTLKSFTMVRSRIRYELIADERTRRETFKKRRTSLFKKLNELKTLCDIEACAIVINEDRTQSEVWPSSHAASQVVQKFIDLPSSSQTNNMVDQAGFLRQNLSRLSKNFDKENRKVLSLERELLLAKCLTKDEAEVGNSNEFHEILRLLERKIGMVDRKIANVEPSSSNMAEGAEGGNNEPYQGKGN